MNQLGHLVFYLISAGSSDSPLEYPLADLVKSFEEYGLCLDFLPSFTKEVDAFRAASSRITATYDVGDDRVSLNVLEIRAGTGVVKRSIIRNATNKRTGATASITAADLEFFRARRVTSGRIHGTAEIKWTKNPALGVIDDVHVSQAIHEFIDRYMKYRDGLGTTQVRAMLRSYLLYIDAIPVEPVGGFFIPADREPIVRQLKDITRQLGPRCSMTVIPLIDTPEQREMIVEAVETEVEVQVAAQLKEINDRSADGPAVPVHHVNRFRGDFVGTRSRVEEYGALLDNPLPRALAALGTLLEALKGQSLAENNHASPQVTSPS